MQKQLILTALLTAALASAAQAAQPADEAWLAFAGCWRADGDSSERLLCIVPDAAGVRMLTVNAGKTESETRVVADGQPRTISQEGCTGTETARWSADRQRVFLNATLNCGNNTVRNVSGIFAVLNGREWVSVQTIATAGTTTVHRVRYVEADDANVPEGMAQMFTANRLARNTVRLGASGRLDLADVRDAVAHADTATVQGWLTSVNQEFDLDAEALIALADAGVPPSVIDVLIAVSHPRHFAVREERANEVGDRRGRRRAGGCYDSYWYDPYNPFGYRGSLGYMNGCRGGIGLYPGWGGYWGGGTVIVVDRNSPLRPRGKVTRDGYKAPAETGSTASQPTRVPSTTTSTSSGSSGGSSGSDDSGGRKAKPRGN